jgi:hypothetical protein
MPDLPQLSPNDEAILELEWETLKRKRGFDGGHLKWPDNPQRRREAARPPYSLPSPPPPPTDSMYWRPPPESHMAHLLAQAEQAWKNYQERKNQYETEWAARINDPVIIDTMGIRETTEFALEHFGQIFEVYRTLWKTAMVRLILQEESGRKEPAGEHNWLRIYTWLEEIGSYVSDKIGELWSPRGLWYERVCKPEVDVKLKGPKGIIEKCRDKLRDEDLQLRKVRKDICSGRQSYDDQFLTQRSASVEAHTSISPIGETPPTAATPGPQNGPAQEHVRKLRSVRINGPFLRKLRLDAGYPSQAAFLKAMGSVVKKSTYNAAERIERIDRDQARLLVEEINALLCPKDLKKPKKPITFEDLTLPD